MALYNAGTPNRSLTVTISTLNSLSNILPEPASIALKLLASLIDVVSLLLDNLEMKSENRELVERLKCRAITLQELIQEHAQLVRTDSFLNHFRSVIESIKQFIKHYNGLSGFQKSMGAAGFRSSLKDHWANLTELHIEFQTHLLCSAHMHGPHRLISDPNMSAFWKFQLQNQPSVRWTDFWENFLFVFEGPNSMFFSDDDEKVERLKRKIERRSKYKSNWVSPADIEYIFFGDGLCLHKSIAKIASEAEAPKAWIGSENAEGPRARIEEISVDSDRPSIPVPIVQRVNCVARSRCRRKE